MNFKVLTAGITTAIALFSCMMDTNIDLDIPDPAQEYVLECYLIPGEFINLSLTKIIPTNKQLILEPVYNANVNIRTENQTYHLNNYQGNDKVNGRAYNYSSPDKIDSDYAGEINISIITEEGYEIKANTKAFSDFKVYDIIPIQSSTSIKFQNSNIKNERYYLVIAEGGSKRKSSNKKCVDNTHSNSDTIVVNVENNYQKWENSSVSVYKIDKANYEFQKSVSDANDSQENVFLSPTSVISNVTGAKGIFTYARKWKTEI